jgi:uncharacterized protein
VKASRYNLWVNEDGVDFVYNGMSGAMLKLIEGERDAVERYLAGDRASGCSASLLESLARGRMLVSDETDELELLATRYALSRGDTSRLALTIVTSLGCNFDCPYCFEDKHPSILDGEVEAAIVQLLDDQLPTINMFNVCWYGGEPLVGKRPLLALSKAFIARCDAAGVGYSSDIITNGYLLDEQTCRDLRECRVSSAQITLDGPPDIHNVMRPLAGGGATFDRIIENLRHAVEYMSVAVRCNVDAENFARVEELLQILAVNGLSGRLQVYLGQLVAVDDGSSAPSATYRAPCFSNKEFAAAQTAFTEMAMQYGFAGASVPAPSGAPCTAVRTNEFIVGSDGELYKCWESVGNPTHVIGNIRDYRNINGRLRRWISYDPFTNEECRSCPALPVCMGGCAHHGMDVLQYENRCDTFRHNYRDRIGLMARTVGSGLAGVAVAAPSGPRMDTR